MQTKGYFIISMIPTPSTKVKTQSKESRKIWTLFETIFLYLLNSQGVYNNLESQYVFGIGFIVCKVSMLKI
jgi:hypothetical protein